MRLRLRNIAWPMLASLAVLVLALGAVLAHEGRPVGDYRLIVGWQHEPAYEGSQNAVSIRVNKIVEGEGDAHDHGDHDHDPTPEPTATLESHDHDHDHDHDPTPEPTATLESHDHDHDHGPIAAGSVMSVEVEAFADSVSGVNLHVIPTGFTFDARSVNGEHVDGEGHAHVYVDGVKVSRVYTPWVYLGNVAPGEREIRVTLNANHHPEYTWNGHLVEATTRITVPDPHGHTHGPETVEADSRMAVSLTVEEDPLGGGNLFVETEGFTFAPQNSGGDHVPGEGHAHIYVNGVKIGRLYGHAMQLGKLAAGSNEVRVTLNTNDHSDYTWNGQPVEATVTVDIPESLGGPGYGGSHSGNSMAEKEGQSSVLPSQGGGKPLASVAGQHTGVAVPVGRPGGQPPGRDHPRFQRSLPGVRPRRRLG